MGGTIRHKAISSLFISPLLHSNFICLLRLGLDQRKTLRSLRQFLWYALRLLFYAFGILKVNKQIHLKSYPCQSKETVRSPIIHNIPYQCVFFHRDADEVALQWVSVFPWWAAKRRCLWLHSVFRAEVRPSWNGRYSLSFPRYPSSCQNLVFANVHDSMYTRGST